MRVKQSFVILFVSIVLCLATSMVCTQSHATFTECGKIESGKLNIPSYKFVVNDKSGNRIENLQIEGEIIFTEAYWDYDYWAMDYHTVSIPMTFDSETGLYISKAIEGVKIGLMPRIRKNPPCNQQLRSFSFTFTLGNWSPTTGFRAIWGSQRFENKSVEEINLPDSKNPIKIVLRNWDGNTIF